MSLILIFGLFSTGNHIRYLLPLAPVLALFALQGFNLIIDKRTHLFSAAIVLILFLAVNRYHYQKLNMYYDVNYLYFGLAVITGTAFLLMLDRNRHHRPKRYIIALLLLIIIATPFWIYRPPFRNSSYRTLMDAAADYYVENNLQSRPLVLQYSTFLMVLEDRNISVNRFSCLDPEDGFPIGSIRIGPTAEHSCPPFNQDYYTFLKGFRLKNDFRYYFYEKTGS
ncbi:MAG: hypothetical protein ABH879_05145 [archaeon]